MARGDKASVDNVSDEKARGDKAGDCQLYKDQAILTLFFTTKALRALRSTKLPEI